MKIYIHKVLLLALLAFSPIAAHAGEIESKEFFYGVVDGAILQESRIIIDDISYLYTKQSDLKNAFGRQLSGMKRNFKKGSYVQYSFTGEGEKMNIESLKVISKQKYDFEKIKKQLEDY